MKKFIEFMEKLPLWAKIVIALPFADIVWNVYRLFKSIRKKNVLGIVLAAVLLVIGAPFVWLVDIITIIINNYVLWID